MKAISFRQHLPIENPESLIDVTIDAPTPGPRDLLVRVQAVSVNPVDTKIEREAAPDSLRES
jgi:NADPH:quinone reductase-like Zn-dependent oxidoreductase